MPLGILFWVLMLIWLIFGIWTQRTNIQAGTNWGVWGGNLLIFILLFVLG
jgi:hypothetical protein